MFGDKAREIARLNQVQEMLKTQLYNESSRVKELEEELNLATQEKQSWIEDYQALNDRYTLLDSLLKQLRVNVTLPAKKIARQN